MTIKLERILFIMFTTCSLTVFIALEAMNTDKKTDAVKIEVSPLSQLPSGDNSFVASMYVSDISTFNITHTMGEDSQNSKTREVSFKMSEVKEPSPGISFAQKQQKTLYAPITFSIRTSSPSQQNAGNGVIQHFSFQYGTKKKIESNQDDVINLNKKQSYPYDLSRWWKNKKYLFISEDNKILGIAKEAPDQASVAYFLSAFLHILMNSVLAKEKRWAMEFTLQQTVLEYYGSVLNEIILLDVNNNIRSFAEQFHLDPSKHSIDELYGPSIKFLTDFTSGAKTLYEAVGKSYPNAIFIDDNNKDNTSRPKKNTCINARYAWLMGSFASIFLGLGCYYQFKNSPSFLLEKTPYMFAAGASFCFYKAYDKKFSIHKNN